MGELDISDGGGFTSERSSSLYRETIPFVVEKQRS